MHTVALYTDGSCSGNPGPGGWAAVLVMTKADGSLHSKELSGPLAHTTNNYAELYAVVCGLAALTSPCAVTVVTDSQCVMGWVMKGPGKDTPLPVRELIYRLRATVAAAGHTVTCTKVAGHSGHVYNERCDELARAATLVAKSL